MSRVMFWSAGNDGCAFYRCVVPAEELARRGHLVHVAYGWEDEYRGKGDGWLKPDVLIGQRVCNPGPSSVWQKTCRDPNIHCVFEVDDDLFTIDQSNIRAHEFFGDKANRERLIQNIKAADAVTVSTQALADTLYKYNKKISVVPNTIPKRYMKGPLAGEAGFDVGWHGSITHIMDWEFCADQIKRWFRRNEDRSFLMIGADYASDWKLRRYRFRDWITPVPALWDAFDFRIGLAPLRPHIFNRSKSHIKALEYASRGIPVLASDCEPYRDFVDHENSGILIKRDYEWSKWLSILANEPSHAAMMGRAAFKRAQEYTTELWGAAWAEALSIRPYAATLGV